MFFRIHTGVPTYAQLVQCAHEKQYANKKQTTDENLDAEREAIMYVTIFN